MINEEAKTERINFRVTFGEKHALNLMVPQRYIGDYVRRKTFITNEYLQYCEILLSLRKRQYEDFLVDLKNMEYIDLVQKYEDEFIRKWEQRYPMIKKVFNCEETQDESGYYTEDEGLQKFLKGEVLELMKNYYDYWRDRYRLIYPQVVEEMSRTQKVLSELPKPE